MRADFVTVSVSDEGPGVAVADREAIFNRFVQFDTGGRAGLGLTIAQTFVKAHGDHIWYEDAPSGGASFVFSMHSAATTKDSH
jgi:signal transduction histidine kinase